MSADGISPADAIRYGLFDDVRRAAERISGGVSTTTTAASPVAGQGEEDA